MKLWLILFVSALALSVLTVGIYLAVYSKIANDSLHNTKRRRMISPRIILAIMLVFTAVVPLCGFTIVEKGVFTATEIYSFGGLSKNADEIKGTYLEAYSPEENIGYKKNDVIKSGDFSCALFVSEGLMDDFHPYYLIFVENDGTQTENLYYSYTTSAKYKQGGTDKFSEIHDSNRKSASDMLLFYGDATHDCEFTLTIYFYDTANVINANHDVLSSMKDEAKEQISFVMHIDGWHMQ